MSTLDGWHLLPLAAILGCPGTSNDTTDTATTATATAATTSGTADTTFGTGTTSGEPTSTSVGSTSMGSTSGQETTGAPNGDGAGRAFFMTLNDNGDAVAVQVVDVLDGVVSAPTEVLTAPAGLTFSDVFSLSPNKRWLGVESISAAPFRTWIIDTQTLMVKEITAAPADSVLAPRFSPDSEVLGVLGSTQGGPSELYACALADNGDCAPTKVSPPLQPMELLRDAELVGGGWVVYEITVDGAGSRAAIGNLATPGVATDVATYPQVFTDVGGARLDAAQKGLYYLADADTNATYQVYGLDLGVVPPGKAALVHPAVVADARGRLSDDAASLLWWAGDGLYSDLWRIPLQGGKGGTPVLLNSAPGQAFSGFFTWSPEGSRVAFLAGADPDTNDLYVTDAFAEPPNPAKVNLTATPGGAKRSYFAPDGQRIAFEADTGPNGGVELYLSNLAGPLETTKLSVGEMSGALFTWAANGERILYSGDPELPSTYDLYAVDVSGAVPSPPAKLNDPLPDKGRVWLFDLTADGRRAFFIAEPEKAVYTVAFGGDGQPSPPVKISAPVQSLLVLPPPG